MITSVKRIAFISSIIFLFSGIIPAQENLNKFLDRSWGIPEKPLNCASNQAFIESAQIMLSSQNNRNAVLILIARLGNEEKSRELNHRRLFNVSGYIKGNWGVEPEKIVITEGGRTIGFGRVEFYLAGQMVGALMVNKNKDLLVDCYGNIGGLYPDKDKLRRRGQKGKRKNK